MAECRDDDKDGTDQLVSNLLTDQKIKDEENKNDGDSSETLPSKVLHSGFIFSPPDFEDIEDREEWPHGGKWLLFADGDMSRLDGYWTKLKPLSLDGTLLCVKASTGTDPEQGVLMCYTGDSNNRAEIKRAADAIRDATSDEAIMYYKTNQSSDEGKYISQGDRCITKYMHSVAKSMYERDKFNRWKKMIL